MENKLKNVNQISNDYLELQSIVMLKFHSNQNNRLKETLEINMYCTSDYVTVFKWMFMFNWLTEYSCLVTVHFNVLILLSSAFFTPRFVLWLEQSNVLGALVFLLSVK